MMRQMQSALRTLINMQSLRQKAAAAKQPVAPPEPQPDLVAPAEDHATMHPGGLPPRLDFVPPEPAVIQALVDGTPPLVSALDHLERPTEPVSRQETLSHALT
jgi:hypothetical protein